jgi:hypothetical protein
MELRVSQVRRLLLCISRVRTTSECLALCEGLGHPRPPIFARAVCATHAHSPCACGIGFCVIWVCVSSSSSLVLRRADRTRHQRLRVRGPSLLSFRGDSTIQVQHFQTTEPSETQVNQHEERPIKNFPPQQSIILASRKPYQKISSSDLDIVELQNGRA